mmetsp:Transcript_75378/g.174748  ORF Transcript_75378/g.174748 Transcript_75378/m.174748 type:complete len:221 (-) Transcript_75378:766-1428(-)
MPAASMACMAIRCLLSSDTTWCSVCMRFERSRFWWCLSFRTARWILILQQHAKNTPKMLAPKRRKSNSATSCRRPQTPWKQGSPGTAKPHERRIRYLAKLEHLIVSRPTRCVALLDASAPVLLVTELLQVDQLLDWHGKGLPLQEGHCQHPELHPARPDVEAEHEEHRYGKERGTVAQPVRCMAETVKAVNSRKVILQRLLDCRSGRVQEVVASLELRNL